MRAPLTIGHRASRRPQRHVRNLGQALTATLTAATVWACASSGARLPDENPALVAAVHAEPRMVSGETTWVSRGPGYELVGFTKRDIADVDSAVARQSLVYSQLFGQAPPEVAVTVHRISFGPKAPAYQPAPPLPPGSVEPVVEIPIVDPSSRPEGNRGRGYGGGFAVPGGANATERVMRAWLSARASQLLGHPSVQGATGLVDDPRVPSWAETLVPALAADEETVNGLSMRISANVDALFPLRMFFTMPRPQTEYARGGESGGADRGGVEGRGGEGRGGEGGEGGDGGGFGGGFGGMGGGGYGRGMGGGYGGGYGRGGMGRGGMPRGGGRPDNAGGESQALRGGAMYSAEATVLGRFLMTREGAPLIGQMVDAQLRGKPVDDVLAAQSAGPRTLGQLDDDWRQWLDSRAKAGKSN